MSYIPCGSQSPYASMENSREGLLYEEISEQDGWHDLHHIKKKEKKIQKGITTFIVVIYGEQVKTGVFYLTCFIILFKFLNDIQFLT